MGITTAIANYILENHLSVDQIVKDTGVDERKLQPETEEILSGEEMLSLCAYLRIKPEEIETTYHDCL